MEPQERSRLEAQSQQIRSELKTWETTFAKTHHGKKPSRGDIKATPEIAQKYKEYNKIRDLLAGKTVASAAAAAATAPSRPQNTQQAPTPKKRHAPQASESTPSKRSRPMATPSKPAGAAHYSSALTTPSTARKLFGSPTQVPTSIGPTPQRDGRVLGLFDLMTASPAEAYTPSKRTGAMPLAATPKRDPAGASEASLARRRLARTPVSSEKRRALEGFTTPLGRRDGNSVPAAAGLDRTPTSRTPADKKEFATPQFLRRLPPAADSTARTDENGDAWDEDADAEIRRYTARLPRKPLVRGLSSVVASLRKMEEEKLDDDLDALREMEAEMMEGGAGGLTCPAPNPRPTTKPQLPAADGPPEDHVLVADSQVLPTNMLGGFDDEAIYDGPEDVSGGLDRHGQPLRVFKKKGQKRTTRRSNMRPVRSKRPAAQPAPHDGEDDDDDDDGHLVPETRRADDTTTHPAHELDNPSESEYESGGEPTARKAAGKAGRKKAAAGEDGGRVARAVRKVSAMAHQNFRRLKLRNNGAKGGPGFNSKFRRRR